MIYYIYMFSGKLTLKVHKCILLRTGSQCNEMWSTIWVLRGCKTLQGKRLIDWLITWNSTTELVKLDHWNSKSEPLTPLAAQLTVRELDSSLRATRWTYEEKGDVVDVVTDSGVYTVSDRVTPDGNVPSCSCSFSSSQLLPCRHIFKVASRCWDVEFCDTWVPKQWQLSYQMPQAPKVSRSVTIPSAACPPSSGPLGKREKFRQVFSLLKLMADACADCGQREFLARYELLQQLQTMWSEGKTAALAELVDAPDVQPDHPSEEHPAQDGLPTVQECSVAVVKPGTPTPVEERLVVLQSTDPAPPEERPAAEDDLPPVQRSVAVFQPGTPPPVEERLVVLQSTDPAPPEERPAADDLPPVQRSVAVFQPGTPPPVEERLVVLQSTDPDPPEERPAAEDGLPPVQRSVAVFHLLCMHKGPVGNAA